MYGQRFDDGGNDQSIQMARRKFSMPAPSFQREPEPPQFQSGINPGGQTGSRMGQPIDDVGGPPLAPAQPTEADTLPGDAPQMGHGGMTGQVIQDIPHAGLDGPASPPADAPSPVAVAAPPRPMAQPPLGPQHPSASGGSMGGQPRPMSNMRIAGRAAAAMPQGGLIGAGASAVADYMQRRRQRQQGWQQGQPQSHGPALAPPSPGPGPTDSR